MTVLAVLATVALLVLARRRRRERAAAEWLFETDDGQAVLYTTASSIAAGRTRRVL